MQSQWAVIAAEQGFGFDSCHQVLSTVSQRRLIGTPGATLRGPGLEEEFPRGLVSQPTSPAHH